MKLKTIIAIVTDKEKFISLENYADFCMSYLEFMVQLPKRWMFVFEDSLLRGWSLSHYSHRHDYKRSAPKPMPTHAVWRRHGARVALLRSPVPRDDRIVLYYAVGLNAINSGVWGRAPVLYGLIMY